MDAGPTAADPSAFLDPFTGQVSDIPGFLRYLSESKGGRQQLFREGLQGSGAYQNAPSSVRSFLGSRFNPLEAQYLAQGIAEPGRGLGNFADFSRQNAQGLGGQGWKDLFSNLWGQFGGVGSAADVDALGGPAAAGYDVLRNRGLELFGQAIQANLNPVLSRAADRVLGQRFADYGRAEAGAPSNQMEFLRQQLPGWQSILGNVPTPSAPIRPAFTYGEPSDFDDLSGEAGFGAPGTPTTPSLPPPSGPEGRPPGGPGGGVPGDIQPGGGGRVTPPTPPPSGPEGRPPGGPGGGVPGDIQPGGGGRVTPQLSFGVPPDSRPGAEQPVNTIPPDSVTGSKSLSGQYRPPTRHS